MHVRLAVATVALMGAAPSLVAQAVPPIPVDSAPTATASFFRLEGALAQPDTVTFNTSVSGNYLYGRNDYALFRWENAVGLRTHQRLVIRLITDYGVGLATNDDGNRYMDRRWWKAQGTADLDPLRRLSPFVLASVEGSLELRIDRRITAGAGAKLTLFRRQPALGSGKPLLRVPPNRMDVSLAVTGEQNELPPVPGNDASASLPRNLTRLSARFRWSQRLTERVWFDQTTWFKPELLALHRYNAELNSRLSYALTRRTQLTLASRHNYEGSASARGAKNNRIGSIDLGVSINLGGRGR